MVDAILIFVFALIIAVILFYAGRKFPEPAPWISSFVAMIIALFGLFAFLKFVLPLVIK